MTFRSQYQRNVTGRGPVDTGPPRTNTGLTGLGAVGGATGVGAGALRVIVEFLTQYDSKELKRLEAELDKLQRREDRNNTRAATFRKQEAQAQGALTRLQNIQERARLSFTRDQQKEIKTIRDLERSRAQNSVRDANIQKGLLAQQTGFRKAEISQLINADRIEARAAERKARSGELLARVESRITQNQKQQTVFQQQIARAQALRANLAPKLGALALGAVGGVFGGAVVGLGFVAAQALIDAIGQGLKDMIDPANKAREALKGVADSIDKIAEKEGLTTLEATRQFLDELGPAAAGVSDDFLAQALATQQLTEDTEKLAAVLEIVRQLENLQTGAVKKLVEQLVAAQVAGRARFGVAANIMQAYADPSSIRLNAQEQAILDTVLKQLGASSDRAANAQARLAAEERAAASAAALNAVMQDRLVSKLQSLSGLRVTGLRDQLDALSSAGPGPRTRALESQLEGMAEAQAQMAYSSQLAQIQEERSLVLLEQRIRFQGQSVALDQLSARGQLVAIDARIEALNRAGEAEKEQLEIINGRISALRKEDQVQDKRDQEALSVYDKQIEALRERADEQDRFNRLLDLQYRLSQPIKRQEGESIGGFISRRANETRALLAEQAALGRTNQVDAIQGARDELEAQQEVANATRESAIEAMELEAEQLQATLERIDKARQAEIRALNDHREQLQLEVRLQELAEQEKQLAAQETARVQTKAIQTALAKAQEADRKAVESRRRAIQEQIDAEERKLEQLLKWTDVENIERLKAAIAGAHSYGEVQAIIGEVAGAKRVLGELRALVAAGVLPYNFVSDRIANLVQLIRLAENRMASFVGRGPRIPTAPRPMAQGGVFMLSNANNNPFSANIKTGEEGHELGVIIPNRLTNMITGMLGNRPPPMSFVVNRSDDPFRDKSRFGRVVRQALSEALD
jgi:hypothetical protein